MTLEKNSGSGKSLVNQGLNRDPSPVSERYARMDTLEKLAPILANEIADGEITGPIVLASGQYCIDYAATLLRFELSRRKVEVRVSTMGQGTVYNLDEIIARKNLG